MSIQLLRKAAFTICLLAVGLFAAENPFAGTWKLNAAKSKLAGTGIGPSGGVRVESDGTTYKASVDTTDEKGQPVKFDYEATLDGKPSKVTGSATIDELSLKRVNDHTIDATGKKNGNGSIRTNALFPRMERLIQFREPVPVLTARRFTRRLSSISNNTDAARSRGARGGVQEMRLDGHAAQTGDAVELKIAGPGDAA